MSKVLIIGAGHAGGSVAAYLRQYGFTGEIVLTGAERTAPYQRPPLSKAWLKGEADEQSLLLRSFDFYSNANIELRLGATATLIDRLTKQVTFADGHVEPYDYLVIATGSRARRLSASGGDDETLLELRSISDADRLKASLGRGKRLAIIGAGYVGLEAAASARALGAEAVIVERMDRVLQRVASPPLSEFFTRRHKAEGVDIRTGVEVVSVSGRAVHFADDKVLEADAVLVGIGAVANDELAAESGLKCDNGIIVDSDARTSDPSVFAIGDVTRRPLVHYGVMHRLESVPNALEQAKRVACTITERALPAAEVPWFWSDQYDCKLQIAGLPFGATTHIVRGDTGSGSFAVFHLNDNRIICVEAVNAAQSFMFGKKAIATGYQVDSGILANPDKQLNSVFFEYA